MSWSVASKGTPAEVRGQLSTQFKSPLASKPAGLTDDGERQTVQLVSELLEQILSTIDPAKSVNVSAYGSMGYSDYTSKKGPYQEVTVIFKL